MLRRSARRISGKSPARVGSRCRLSSCRSTGGQSTAEGASFRLNAGAIRRARQFLGIDTMADQGRRGINLRLVDDLAAMAASSHSHASSSRLRATPPRRFLSSPDSVIGLSAPTRAAGRETEPDHRFDSRRRRRAAADVAASTWRMRAEIGRAMKNSLPDKSPPDRSRWPAAANSPKS